MNYFFGILSVMGWLWAAAVFSTLALLWYSRTRQSPNPPPSPTGGRR